MLFKVPAGMSRLSLPDTVTVPGFELCLNCRWLPFVREWASRFSHQSSEERARWLTAYVHFYNYHRAHTAIDYNPPISRLDRKNVLRRNS